MHSRVRHLLFGEESRPGLPATWWAVGVLVGGVVVIGGVLNGIWWTLVFIVPTGWQLWMMIRAIRKRNFDF